VSDDRDRRRPGDPLHRAVTASGEFDSRDDVTPVHILRRIEGKIDEGRIAADIDADMPEHFARLEARCVAAEQMATRADARWKWPMRILAVLATFSTGAVTYVVTRVRDSGYEARVSEEQREATKRNTSDLRDLRESVIDLRARFEAWRPLGAIPVIGPRDKDE
jgi:hypothetical protein